VFGTSGIRGPVGRDVTADTALSVGRALPSEGYRSVVVGRDPRESGRMLVDALAAGIRECGGDVVDLGVASTPTVARSVERHGADAGVAVTASHNPPPDNGLKLWTPSGQAFDAARREGIERRIDSGEYDLAAWDGVGERTTDDAADAAHAAALREAVEGPIDLDVVVDVGNGAGGLTADVLDDLGCHVTTVNARPDGSFPGRPSEPTAETLTTLRATVANTDADVGVAHDGDADRMMAVDATGAFVPGDVLLAVFATRAVEPGDRVAAPVDTSLSVDDALEERGATVARTAVGDVFVAERAREPDVTFGGEPSGAWIWPEETLCPDGPLAACRLVELVDEEGPLADLTGAIETYPIRRESVAVDAGTAVVRTVERLARERHGADRVDTLDGVRIDHGDGWTLVRASGTQPLVRLTAEARDPERAATLLDEARGLLAEARAER